MFRVPFGEWRPMISVPGEAARLAAATITSSTISDMLGLTARSFTPALQDHCSGRYVPCRRAICQPSFVDNFQSGLLWCGLDARSRKLARIAFIELCGGLACGVILVCPRREG